MLTLVFAVAAPISFGSTACFLSTEGDGYDDYETYGTSGSCELGWEGCSCTTGGQCNPGFKCDNNQNICFLDTCPVGTEGCDCTPFGSCDPGLMCASEFCVDPGPQCPAGTEACPCTENGGCDPNLACLSGFCVDNSGADEESDGGATTDGSDDTTGGACSGGCDSVPVCGGEPVECPCDCVAECQDDSAVTCVGDANPCALSELCDNGCIEADDGPECIPDADSSGG